MRRSAALLALALPWLAAVPSAAQNPPTRIWPTRDVAVTYSAGDGRGTPRTVQAAWLAAEKRLRVEPPDAPGWVLVDVPRGEAVMVMDALRTAMRLPDEQKLPLTEGLPPGTAMTPAGSATVAGLRCNNWRVSSPEGQGTICLTPDGVLLRAQGTREGKQGTLEASAVSYTAQDPARFRLPADYRNVTLPPGLLKNLPPGLTQGILGLSR